MSSFSVTQQRLLMSDVRQITVTENVLDTVNDIYTRAVRFFGDPIVDGAPTLLIEIVVKSANQQDLQITAPQQQF